MNILKPKQLRYGDTIGIVASSLPVIVSSKKNYMRGKRLLEEMGYKIREGKTIGPIKSFMAGTPEEVAQDINSMFVDKKVKAIFAADGGYSAISVINYLDYELIKENPKPFIGFSDMTIYHLAILKMAGMVGFHMDHLSTFNGEHIWNFYQILTEAEPFGRVAPISEWEEWKKGKAQGHLIGGLLERISVLAGTKYFPNIEYFDGAILFWEQVGGDVTDIYQYLYQLKNMGIFEKINGMLIGKIKYIKPLRDKEVLEPTVKEMVLEILKDYKFPIMANMDFGHFTINIPMPIGIKVSFDTERQELNFLESAVI